MPEDRCNSPDALSMRVFDHGPSPVRVGVRAADSAVCLRAVRSGDFFEGCCVFFGWMRFDGVGWGWLVFFSRSDCWFFKLSFYMSVMERMVIFFAITKIAFDGCNNFWWKNSTAIKLWVFCQYVIDDGIVIIIYFFKLLFNFDRRSIIFILIFTILLRYVFLFVIFPIHYDWLLYFIGQLILFQYLTYLIPCVVGLNKLEFYKIYDTKILFPMRYIYFYEYYIMLLIDKT